VVPKNSAVWRALTDTRGDSVSGSNLDEEGYLSWLSLVKLDVANDTKSASPRAWR
jgi:hypothetical protein